MPFEEESKELGFSSSEDYVVELYKEGGFSLRYIKGLSGLSLPKIRKILMKRKVELKGRGGPNNLNRRKLMKVEDDELFQTSVRALVEKYGVHESTVLGERKARRERW